MLMKLIKLSQGDWRLQFKKATLTWEHWSFHYIWGIVYWPGLDAQGNTRKSFRLIGFPFWRWIPYCLKDLTFIIKSV
jgi:hypothetical protein